MIEGEPSVILNISLEGTHVSSIEILHGTISMCSPASGYIRVVATKQVTPGVSHTVHRSHQAWEKYNTTTGGDIREFERSFCSSPIHSPTP